MDDNSIELFLAIFSGILLMFLMSGFIITMVFIHRQRQVKNRHKVDLLKADFDKTILNVEKEIREETLHFVSQELHDNIGQMLSLTKLVLNNPDPSGVSEGKRLLNQIIKEVRNLSRSINKDYIYEVKIQDFIAEELQKLEKSGFCKTSLQIEGTQDDLSDSNKKLVLIRMVQECLNNAIKHASPSTINIKVTQNPQLITIQIEDDGKGFDPSSPLSKGLGLINLRSRMETIAGRIDIQTYPDKGTRIKMMLPL